MADLAVLFDSLEDAGGSQTLIRLNGFIKRLSPARADDVRDLSAEDAGALCRLFHTHIREAAHVADESRLEQQQPPSDELLTEVRQSLVTHVGVIDGVLRVGRSLCAGRPESQRCLREAGLAEMLVDSLDTLVAVLAFWQHVQAGRSDDSLMPKVQRSLITFFINLVTANDINQSHLWKLVYPWRSVKLALIAGSPSHMFMLLHNISCQSAERRAALAAEEGTQVLYLMYSAAVHHAAAEEGQGQGGSDEWVSIFSHAWWRQPGAFESLFRCVMRLDDDELQLIVLRQLDPPPLSPQPHTPNSSGGTSSSMDRFRSHPVRARWIMERLKHLIASQRDMAAYLLAMLEAFVEEEWRERNDDGGGGTTLLQTMVADGSLMAFLFSLIARALTDVCRPAHRRPFLPFPPDTDTSPPAAPAAEEDACSLSGCLRPLARTAILLTSSHAWLASADDGDHHHHRHSVADGLIRSIVSFLDCHHSLRLRAMVSRKDRRKREREREGGGAEGDDRDVVERVWDEVSEEVSCRDLIRVVANLLHDDHRMQDTCREIDGLRVLLNHTLSDEKDPLMKESSIFAIRNACHTNAVNKSAVRQLLSGSFQGVIEAPDELMAALERPAAAAEDGGGALLEDMVRARIDGRGVSE